MKNNYNLIADDIPKLIKKIAIPASVGFFFNTMYNVVDTFFGGQISTEALAALSLSFPVFFIIIAMGSGISTGTTVLVANSLGAGETKEARLFSIQSISFALIVGIILSILGYFFSPFLFRVLSADGNYLHLAVSYMNIILIGATLFILTFVFNGILNAQGDTATFRNFLIAGFFLNLLLNPALIYGWLFLPAMGFAGIAWATVFIQLLGVLYMGYKLINSDLICKDCYKMFKPDLKYFGQIFGQGFPASLNMLTVAIGVFVITYFISPFGKEAVAAYGIATRVDQLALLPMIGLNIATLTLIGQNNGAKLYERCRLVYKKAMTYGLIITIFGALAVLVFARFLMELFSDDPLVVQTGTSYLHVSILVYCFYTILYMTVSALQGLKKPMYAIWIGIYRQAVAPLLIFYLFTQVFTWGLKGIWWGIFVINGTAAVVSLVYTGYVFKKLFNNSQAPSAQ